MAAPARPLLLLLLSVYVCSRAAGVPAHRNAIMDASSPALTRQIIMENAGLCLAKGGICTLLGGCPPDLRYEGDGLCGRRQDVACCTQLPVTEGLCSERGGECVSPKVCHNGPRDNLGVCSPGLVCCVWV